MHNMRKTKVKRKSRRRVYTKKMRGGVVYKCKNNGYKTGYNATDFNIAMKLLNGERAREGYARKACSMNDFTWST